MQQITEKYRLPWLDEIAESLLRRLRDERLGHALLLSGPTGTGKRMLAHWLCRRYLAQGGESPEGPRWPTAPVSHPDVAWISPEEGKRSVSVEQIRGLVGDLGLKSHAGGGKAAVIEPADAMTLNAANSLLKTLEEPPGDALIILVADTLSGMPATILSRCAVLRVPLPAPAAALKWLEEAEPDSDWGEALALAGGAPLRAVGYVRDGKAELPERFRSDLEQIVGGRKGPLEIAAGWAKPDAAFALDWLERTVRTLIRRRLGGASHGPAGVVPESVLQRMDSQNLFCYLDRLTRLRNQPKGSYNEQLALESLLIPWAEEFRGSSADPESTPLGLPARGVAGKPQR